MTIRTRVGVGPFAVDDLSRRQVIERAVELATDHHQRPVRVYALHVGGLNRRDDGPFVEEMTRAELVYADGGSIVALGKLAGAQRLQRAPTTDIGWDILRGISARLGRPARLGLIGGAGDLAEQAGLTFQAAEVGVLAFSAGGFQESWAPIVDGLRSADVDVVVVGLGAPREMLWVGEWLDRLPPVLVMTCGGWFGFVTGDERRAGGVLRQSGLEWIARLAQSPRRLSGRYLKGVWSSGVVALQTLRSRMVETS